MTRAEAARTNTQKEAPTSPQNALHYGLNAADILIPGEDPAEFELMLNDLCRTYCPGSLVEFDLISELAATRWRLRRLPQMEKAAHYAARMRVQNDPENAALTSEERGLKTWNEVTNGPEMKQIHRHETRLRRAWEKGKAELEALVADRLCREQARRDQAQADAAIARAHADLEAIRAANRKPVVQNEPKRTPTPSSGVTQMPGPDDARAA